MIKLFELFEKVKPPILRFSNFKMIKIELNLKKYYYPRPDSKLYKIKYNLLN